MDNIPSVADLMSRFTNIKNVRFLKAGGYKAVYEGFVDGLKEAIKVVYIPKDSQSATEENTKRVLREISILDKIDNPYVVKLGSIKQTVIEIGEHSYVVYSEEFLVGESINDQIESECIPTINDLAKFTFNIISTIEQLKKLRVVHRDIKPENIMVLDDPDRKFVLLDFGIAFVLDKTPLTNRGGIPGTLYYIAPEMLQSDFRSNLDYRADLYTLGLTAYEYATKINPFRRREDVINTFNRIKDITPQKLHDLRPDLPSDFCNLIDQLLKKVPGLRLSNISTIKKIVGVYL